jgi:ParB family chromosome partitioning protein
VFDEEKLEELASSIRAQGVVQPVVVRETAPGEFELIAGERRWRAAQRAGLETIPAVVRDVPDEATVAMSLIENIQRENLNPLEEATALRRLIDEFQMTHREAADAVGRSRASVSNLLRLLELIQEVKDMVDGRLIEMGHARVAVTRYQPVGSARGRQPQVLRETEPGAASAAAARNRRAPTGCNVQKRLEESLCAKVKSSTRSAVKELTISYNS